MAVTPVLCEFNNIFLGNVICHLMAYLEVIELLFVHAFNEKPVSIDIPVRTFSAPAVIRMLCCLSNPLPDIGVNFFSGTAVPAAFLLPAFFCYFFLPFLYFLIFLCQSFFFRLLLFFTLLSLSFFLCCLPFIFCLLICQAVHINLFKEFSKMLGIRHVRTTSEYTCYPDKMSSAFPYSLFFRI